jgi:prepilin-type N-terminal cleavage/methylation domain-containing protein
MVRRMRRGQSGFTLLEMMVVLVVVGLVSVSLFEALAQMGQVRDRLAPFLTASEREGPLNGWFRQAVNGLVADRVGGEHVLVGGANGFSGLTLEPLGADPGGPTPFQWALVYATSGDYTSLVYSGEGAPPREIRRWPGSKVSFSYLGPDLVWYDSWPPALKRARQLPAAVRLADPRTGFALVGAVKRTVDPSTEGVEHLN